jgi:hypothetical protein
LLKYIENELIELPKIQKVNIKFELIVNSEERVKKQKIVSLLYKELDYKLLMREFCKVEC